MKWDKVGGYVCNDEYKEYNMQPFGTPFTEYGKKRTIEHQMALN